MSRKSALQTLTASGLFPSPHTSSPLVSEKSTPRNPYILQEETIPGKTPYTRRHHGKSSGLISESKGSGGKDGRNGGKNGNGGNQGQSDNGSESSSSQDDEDEDDEEADEEDEEEPAVSGPVRANDSGETAIVDKSFLGHPARATTLTVKESLKGEDHRTGSNLRKRSFSIVMDNNGEYETGFDAENETGDESDYPRKRVATELSNTSGILAYHSASLSVVATDTTPYDLAELNDLDDLDDEDILDDEESALIQEFEANGCDTPLDLSTPHTIYAEYGDEDPTDPNLITAEELEDLDNEVFGVGWGDPNAFHDIALANDFTSFSDPFAGIQLDYGLFPESISEMSVADLSTPFETPSTVNLGDSVSGILSEPNTPENSTESDDGDDDMNDFDQSEHADTVGGDWAEDSEEEHGTSCKHFSKGEVNGGQGDEDSETGEGETTDEEDDLPMPTPRSKSMLRRASVSSVGSSPPQVVHIDNTSAGHTVASWVADPNRTICVIDGSKKTFLLPGASRGYEFSTGGTDISQLMLEESESEKSTGPIGYNPTLGGLAGGDELFLNEGDILGPIDALYDNFDVDGLFDLDGDLITNDDDIDEFEHDLQITDFLDFSTDDADGEIHDDNSDDNSDGACDDDEDDKCVGAFENSEDMLARWEQVTVTSFRKRQIQHAQGNNHPNSPTASHKIGDRRLSQTITPARKKKIKSRFMVNNKSSGSSSGVKKTVGNKKSGVNIGLGGQWGLIDRS